MSLVFRTIRYEVRCVECGRRFDGVDAYDLHIQNTPHAMDAVEIVMVQVPQVTEGK